MAGHKGVLRGQGGVHHGRDGVHGQVSAGEDPPQLTGGEASAGAGQAKEGQVGQGADRGPVYVQGKQTFRLD